MYLYLTGLASDAGGLLALPDIAPSHTWEFNEFPWAAFAHPEKCTALVGKSTLSRLRAVKSILHSI